MSDEFLSLVEQLGDGLSSTNGDVRSKALAELVEAIPAQTQGKEFQVVLDFLLNRIGDVASVRPASEGLLKLFTQGHSSNNHAEHTIRRIFQEMFLQSEVISVRHAMFQLFIYLMEHHMTSLKSIGRDFVIGFMQQIDGEKDPRCLLLVFKMVPVVCQNFDVSSVAEDLFDVTACYFPITFKPPPNDPFGVTSDDLKNGLVDCMTASSHFTTFCMDLLMEKVGSSLSDTKIDCYKALTACLNKFPYEKMQSYLPRVYSSIRSDIFQSLSSTVHGSACQTLLSLSSHLSHHSPDQLSLIFEPLLTESKKFLDSSESSVISTLGKLLIAASGGSLLSCRTVIESIMKDACDAWNKQQKPDCRRAVLNVLVGICQACSISRDEQNQNSAGNILAPYKSDLSAIFVDCIQGNDIPSHAPGLTGLTALLRADESDEDLIAKALDVFQHFCINTNWNQTDIQQHGVQTPTIALGVCLAELTQPKDLFEKLLETKSDSVINIVSQLIATPESAEYYFNSTLPFILKSKTEDSTELALAQTTALSYCNIASSWNDDSEVLDKHFIQPLFESIFQICQSLMNGMESDSSILDTTTMSCLIQALRSAQQILMEEVRNERVLQVCDSVKTFLEEKQEKIMNLLSTPLRIITAVLVDCDRSILTSDSCKDILNICCSRLLDPVSPTTAVFLSQIVATFLNKLPKLDEVQEFLAGFSENLQLGQNISACGWICKSLLLRGAVKDAKPITELIFKFLGDSNHGNTISDCIKTIMSDEPILNNSAMNHIMPLFTRFGCTIRIMYRQRFLMTNLDHIVEAFKNAGTDTKPAITKGLLYMLQGVPDQVVVDCLETILPLILESIADSSSDVSLPSLTVLTTLLDEQPEALAEDVTTLIKALLAQTKHPKMKVRMTSLQCLKQVCNLPSHKIFPQARNVTRQLLDTLDDKKRLVRKAAVECRSAWFMVSSASS